MVKMLKSTWVIHTKMNAASCRTGVHYDYSATETIRFNFIFFYSYTRSSHNFLHYDFHLILIFCIGIIVCIQEVFIGLLFILTDANKEKYDLEYCMWIVLLQLRCKKLIEVI